MHWTGYYLLDRPTLMPTMDVLSSPPVEEDQFSTSRILTLCRCFIQAYSTLQWMFNQCYQSLPQKNLQSNGSTTVIQGHHTMWKLSKFDFTSLYENVPDISQYIATVLFYHIVLFISSLYQYFSLKRKPLSSSPILR